MSKFLTAVATLVPLLAGVGAVLAYSKTRPRSRRLGEVDPFEDTAEPEIDPADFEIAPGSYSDDENPSRPVRDEPGWEGGCLILGRKHFRYGDPYRVCLTANQEQKLFKNKRTKLRKLGCGVFACAYESPTPSRVVKLTRDSEDVAALLKAQKTGVVPKIHAVYKLKQGGRTTPVEDSFTLRREAPRHVDVYAMVVDRLQIAPTDERYAMDIEMSNLRTAMDRTEKAGELITVKNVCPKVEDDDGEPGCTTLQTNVIDAYERLAKIGIDWRDMHSGNIGYDKRGKLKVLDLGVTKTELEKEPEILEGRLAHSNLLLAGLVPNA